MQPRGSLPEASPPSGTKVNPFLKAATSSTAGPPTSGSSNPFLKSTSPPPTPSSSNPFLKSSTSLPNPNPSPASNPSPAPNPTPIPRTGSNAASSGNPFLKSATSNQNSSSSTPASSSNPFLAKVTITTPPPLKHSSGQEDWKSKYEHEVERSRELEKQVEMLKKKLQQQQQQQQGNSHGPPPSAEEKKQKRMTRMARQTQHLTMNMGSTLDSVIKQIGGLDKRIRAAEAARLLAEDKLMEIAIAKLEVDEVVQKVDTVLKKIISQIDKFTIPQVKEMLIKVRSQTAPEEELSQGTTATRANCRFTIIMPKDSLILPDAPPPPTAPALPSSFGPVTSSSSSSSSGERNTLLSQIRSGTTLRNVDIKKLKEEQVQHRVDAKKTMDNMKSLEETLREALTTKMLNVLAMDEEDDDDDDFW